MCTYRVQFRDVWVPLAVVKRSSHERATGLLAISGLCDACVGKYRGRAGESDMQSGRGTGKHRARSEGKEASVSAERGSRGETRLAKRPKTGPDREKSD